MPGVYEPVNTMPFQWTGQKKQCARSYSFSIEVFLQTNPKTLLARSHRREVDGEWCSNFTYWENTAQRLSNETTLRPHLEFHTLNFYCVGLLRSLEHSPKLWNDLALSSQSFWDQDQSRNMWHPHQQHARQSYWGPTLCKYRRIY